MRCPLVAAAALAHSWLPRVGAAVSTRPIQFIIPFSRREPHRHGHPRHPPQLAASLGVPVVLVNSRRRGAVAWTGVAQGKPDGYTLAANRALHADHPADHAAGRDVQGLGLRRLGSLRAIDSGVILVKRARRGRRSKIRRPREEECGHGHVRVRGPRTNSYFNMELVAAGLRHTLSHVPFSGSGPVKNALLAARASAPAARSACSP